MILSEEKKCNIPKEEKHISKPKIAQNIIQNVLDKGVKFDFVNFDALYGNATDLLVLTNKGNS